jgi:hypothetical protein
MQTKMTERDKKLLFALVIIVIVFVIGYLGIYPLVKSVREINKEIEEQEALQSENEIKLTNLTVIQVDNEKMEEDIIEKRKDFYPVMAASDIDKLLTGKALSYNLYSYDLDIDVNDTVVSLAPYQYSDRGEDDDADASEDDQEDAVDAADYLDNTYSSGSKSSGSSSGGSTDTGDASSASDGTTTDMSAVGIYVAYVNMRLGGNRADLEKFLDDMVAGGEKVRVVSYSWTEGRQLDYNNDGTYNLVTEKVLDISLELYMSDPGDEVEETE